MAPPPHDEIEEINDAIGRLIRGRARGTLDGEDFDIIIVLLQNYRGERLGIRGGEKPE